MRKLASIQKIKEIKAIEGADSIELATVLGWQVVVGKNQFNVGDLVVYYEIDSFIPVREDYEFLRARSYKKSELLGEGFRLRTMKMRGAISQGLIMPLSDVYIYTQIDEEGDLEKGLPLSSLVLSEGDDVTDLLDIVEWEIPEKASSGGTIIGQASGKIHVTDETRIQTEPKLLEEFRDLDFYITLKMDGSSHSAKIDREGVFHVFGHNYEYKDDGKSSFYNYVKKQNLEDVMRKYMEMKNLESLTVQGEWCGAGIQNNRLGLKEPAWFVFTVDENEKRVGLKEIETFMDVAKAYGCSFEMVPVLEIGSNLPSVYPNQEALLERASVDNSHSYINDTPEGIVIRPTEPVYSSTLGGPLSMKVINNKYLLKERD